MEDEQLDDLKQFIASQVSQSEARLREDLVTKQDLQQEAGGLQEEIGSLRQDVQSGFAGVGTAIEALNTHADERLDDHEARGVS